MHRTVTGLTKGYRVGEFTRYNSRVTKKLDSTISFWMELNMQVEVQEKGLLKFQSLRSCVDKRDTNLVMINLLQL
ncbi:hypothetical protein HanPSC8_Chr01g0002001 [Helianthus annuus]|nr:hypothetical protein HanIR_Chr01g0002491 [Helianthus annuus]KAJ0955363.1 hypothetical protein HanPSC8_Chr01g0002001 [Helianthus annuus]